MSKESELIKNTAVLCFGKICTQLISFLMLPLYTAILSTSEYGTVDLVLTYTALLTPFITLALEQALFRYLIDVRNDEEKCGKYITTTVVVSVSLVTIVLCIMLILAVTMNNRLFSYFGLTLLTGTISSIALQISRGLGDSIGYTLGSSVTAISQILCNVLFLVVLGWGIDGMMLAIIIGNSLCGITIFHRCNLKHYMRSDYFSRKYFIELSKYSVPLIPNQLSWWALNAADKIIVQFFIGVAGNGLIAVANKFSGMYIQFSNIFNISWTEAVALHINDFDAEQFISKTINSVYRLFLCVCCGIIVCMPFVFPIMVNGQYREAYGLIPIFMLASFFNVIVSLYGVIYVAYKKAAEIAKTAIFAATLNIFSHLILIKFIGIYAAALSTLIGYGGMAIYRYFHSRKYIVIKLNNFTLLISGFMLGVSLLVYFSENVVIQISGLIIIVLLSLTLNIEIIKTMLEKFRIKIGKI